MRSTQMTRPLFSQYKLLRHHNYHSCHHNHSSNFGICAQRKVLAKCFKICHIIYIYENPKLLFPFFITCNFIISKFVLDTMFQQNASKFEKNGKNNFGFSYIYNMANFEAFRQNISSSTNFEIMKSGSIAFQHGYMVR